MGRLTIATLFVCGVGILYGQSGQAELWRCAEENGSTVFTDRPMPTPGCQLYNSVPAPSKIAPVPSTETGGYFSTPERRYILKDFATLHRNEPDTFRGITPGMTESQVLKLAGNPDKRYQLPCDANDNGGAFCPKRWVYNYSEKWLVELTLDTGRVTEINRLLRQ